VLSAELVAFAAAGAAAATDPPAASPDQKPPAQTQQGPLVLERINDGWVVAPDVKVTRIDGANRTLVGAYGGWLMDGTLLLGAGGYWEADNGSRHEGMGYGGFVVGWTAPAGRAVRVGGRALVGVGDARLPTTITVTVPQYQNPPVPGMGHDRVVVGSTSLVEQVGIHRSFFIFEPQGTVAIRLLNWMWLDVGGGYRVIGDARGYEDRLRGAVGSVGVRFGPRG
jgi:hypothetical protein